MTTHEVHWLGSTKENISEFPFDVKRDVGFAIFSAQDGGKSDLAKPLKGFKGASVLEISSDDGGDTYRVIYTVKFGGMIYVLHAFKKKSKSGIATPKNEMDLAKSRLVLAEQHSRAIYKKKR